MTTPSDQKRADDVRPDAKKRFEMAVDMALRTPPMHRTAKPKPQKELIGKSKRATQSKKKPVSR